MSDTPIFDEQNNDKRTFEPAPDGVTYDVNSLYPSPYVDTDSIHTTMQPQPKVLAATAGSAVGGAAALLLAWILAMVGVEVPPEVQGAISILLVAGATFGAGWWKKN